MAGMMNRHQPNRTVSEKPMIGMITMIGDHLRNVHLQTVTGFVRELAFILRVLQIKLLGFCTLCIRISIKFLTIISKPSRLIDLLWRQLFIFKDLDMDAFGLVRFGN